MPRRPLSAYNLFFQEQRKKLLGGAEGEADSLACSKRKHRKTHGKIGFADLAKSISQTWHGLKKEEKHKYENEAKIRKQDYFRQLHEYKKKKHNAEKEASNQEEDEDRSDYAAVLVSMSKTTTAGSAKSRIHPVEISQPGEEVKPSVVSSAINPNADWQRRMLDDSVNRQLYSAYESTNLRRECAIRLVQPSLGAVPVHLARGLARNNVIMMNANHGRFAASVATMDNACLHQTGRLNRKTDSLLHHELIKPRHSVLSPLGDPGQNTFHLLDSRLITQRQGLNVPGIAQPPALFSNPPAIPGITFGESGSPYQRGLPTQIHTQLLPQSFAGNSQNVLLQQQQSDLQNLILLSRLQSQGAALQHALRY